MMPFIEVKIECVIGRNRQVEFCLQGHCELDDIQGVPHRAAMSLWEIALPTSPAVDRGRRRPKLADTVQRIAHDEPIAVE